MEIAEWEDLFVKAINALRQQTFVPYDTGNLKFNAIKGMWEEVGKTFVIYIDDAIAPYVYFTNEKWINRKGKNPNENWVDKATKFIAKFIAKELKGSIKK